MAKLMKSILIGAPVEKIFAYMNNPNNLPEIWPSMVEVKDVQTLPNGGACFNYIYKMAGIRLEGFSEDTEYVLNQRTVSKSSGGIEGWTTFSYETTGQGTKVTVDEEYKVPVPVIGKLAEVVIIKLNEHEADVLLENLKSRLESV
jgi:hypothetical protein